MNQGQDKDIALIKDFIQRSAELVGYFELADSKMQEWKMTIEQKIREQESRFQAQSEITQKQLQRFEDVLDQAGLTRVCLMADTIISQSNAQLEAIKKAGESMLQQSHYEQKIASATINDALATLQRYCTDSITLIDKELSQHDPNEFRRIASNSCEQVERTAKDAIGKSKRILHSVRWKTALLTIISSTITAFAIGLYVGDEFPWEIHQHAMNEREAGKLLIQAWPTLSHDDRKKILQQNDKVLG